MFKIFVITVFFYAVPDCVKQRLDDSRYNLHHLPEINITIA